jgi:hypothetical protein
MSNTGLDVFQEDNDFFKSNELNSEGKLLKARGVAHPEGHIRTKKDGRKVQKVGGKWVAYKGGAKTKGKKGKENKETPRKKAYSDTYLMNANQVNVSDLTNDQKQKFDNLVSQGKYTLKDGIYRRKSTKVSPADKGIQAVRAERAADRKKKKSGKSKSITFTDDMWDRVSELSEGTITNDDVKKKNVKQIANVQGAKVFQVTRKYEIEGGTLMRGDLIMTDPDGSDIYDLFLEEDASELKDIIKEARSNK